jgi:hypothetical protein
MEKKTTRTTSSTTVPVVDGLTDNDGTNNTRPRPRPNANANANAIGNASNNTFWQMISLILFGIVVLSATDSIQINHAKDDSSSSSDHSSLLSFGSDVEIKTAATKDHPTSETTTKSTRQLYVPRGRPLSDDDRRALETKWGSWTLVEDDGHPKQKKSRRPTDDYFVDYPNRDIPRTEFPPNAWQTDKDYLSNFLPESLALVQRAQDAILAEYGKTAAQAQAGAGADAETEASSWEERASMFHVEKYDSLVNVTGLDSNNQGGWTTTKSWEGLKRRLLHAIMTEDSFVFAMGGHSAAAGHG